MYSFDLKNVVPSEDLTCLFAKATIDESKLWHRRLGHVNFKTMNKLVKGNLVRGLPSKIFDNDHTCVACQKGKQHKASARTMLADSLLPTVFWAEAVNTACYVLNRVLVTKPHNKTLYELIIGRPPSISFMRPFGCPVTILNTLDPLGKFYGKAEEGFLVGNQTNKNAGSQEANGNTGLKQSIDARPSEEKNVSSQQYIVFPLWSSISSSYKSSDENDTADDSASESPVQKPASENKQALKNILDKMMDQEKEATKQSEVVRKEFEAQCNREIFQGKATKASSTNSFNTVSTPVNAASASRTSNDAGPSYVPLGRSFPFNVNDLPDDPLLPDLEDTAKVQNTSIFCSAFDDEDLDTYNSPFADQVMGAKANFNNMEPSTVVSLIPTTRVHFIHPKDQIIGDPKSAVQTRGMSKKNSKEHAMISYIQKQKRTNHKDFQNCLFACFLSALNDKSWVEAMQEELLQFKIQKVWTLVNLPYGKKAIGTKWVYRNKKDERGLKQSEEVYVSQPLGFVDPKFLEKVYKVEKALYGLHQAPKAWYETLSTYLLDNGFYKGQIDKTLFIKRVKGDILLDKYVGEILKKFGFSIVRTASTPMETNKVLTKDEDDSDYEGASLDRKSITGGCQFLGSRLISWQCKKQTVVTNSSTKADYIAASHCCGQTSVPQDLEADKVVHTDGGDSVERAITTVASLDAAQDSDNIIRTQTTAMPNTRSERVLEKPNEPPLSECHTSGSGKGRMEHQFELMANVPLIPYDSPLPGDDDLDEEDASKQGKGSDKIKPILCNFTLCLWMLKAEEESTMAFELIKFIKSMLEEFPHRRTWTMGGQLVLPECKQKSNGGIFDNDSHNDAAKHFLDYDSEMTEKLFAEYTRIQVKQFRETLLLHMANVKKSVAERTHHKRQYDRRMKERQIQSRESKVVSSKALDASLVVTECSGTKSDEHITSSSSGTYITHVVDADIRPVNDQVPSAEVHLTTQHNVLANVQQHTNQSEPSYDTYLLEKVDSNTTPDSNKLLCHRGRRRLIDAEISIRTVEKMLIKSSIPGKGFCDVALLKNELRKLKGNSVDTKFAKPSILGKPVLQPPRNQSVVRQPNAFKSERPNFSKPRFASQVDVNNVLSKPVTPHYLPKVREYVLAKPHHVIAPGSSRNSQEEPYGSSVMAHNHYLEEARKKTQERNRNSKPSVMHTTSLQNTTNGSKPNPRSNNQISRSLPVSKSSCGMSNGVSLVDHSRNSSSFSDSKHFVCSTCHKCVFNANHDNCITKFLKEVDSRAKVQSPKTRNKNKPVEPKSHTQKPGRQIAIGQRFSPKKSSAVHEKPNTPRSCLRWKPTGRIFKIAGLRWIPTGKMFTDNTTKVDSEPPNGSNGDITNPYECDQTLNVSACTTNSSAVQASLFNDKMTSVHISSVLALQRQNDVCSHQFMPRSSMTK
ncbi:putative ribonuclease H-like domain-containing protein [Tanacetum coccineum]